MDTKNKWYQENAHKYIPGGAHTYSRGDDTYPVNAPPVLARGKGCRVWDADGNEYLDYGMALRAVTVGYAYERIDNAAIEQIRNGNNMTRPSAVEVDAAMKLADLIPGMDMVKFGKNGSTVTSAAVKLARAYTGRKYVAVCAEHPFFSYDDWFIGTTIMKSGIPEETRQLSLTFHYNDIQSLQALFEKHPEDIACTIMEPATTIEPVDGFLQKAGDLCRKYGAVFILDEMITGFRWRLEGAASYYGVVPDLCTFGKGIANGHSVTALLGKREIMQYGGIGHDRERVFLVSTTHGAEMGGMGALIETINVYKELDVISHLWNYGASLVDGLRSIASELGIEKAFTVEGVPVSPSFTCRNSSGEVSMEFRTLFLQEMLKRGVLIPWIALSYSHGDAELNVTLDAARESLGIYRNALESDVSRFLEGRPVKPVFRKFN